VTFDEVTVDPAVSDHVLERPVQERDVAADVDEEETVGDLRAEERAFDVRGDPVALHPGLAEAVDDRDLRSLLLRVVQVLHAHRLIARDVGADEENEVATDPVLVRAGRRADAERLLEPERARGVADAGCIVDRVAAERPDRLLRRVVVLVRLATARHVEAEPVGRSRADALGDQVESIVPSHAVEALLSLPAHHRVREPTEAAELRAALPFETRDILEHARVERGHCVQPQKSQPNVAEMDLVERPVVQAGRPESAPVADAVLEDPPRVAQVVAVLRDRVPDLEVVVRPLLADAERFSARPQGGLPALRHSLKGSVEEGTPARADVRPYRQTGERPRSVSGSDRRGVPSDTGRRLCPPPRVCRSALRGRRSGRDTSSCAQYRAPRPSAVSRRAKRR
jgi:hypothetical protein